jgi:hypothetical protein
MITQHLIKHLGQLGGSILPHETGKSRRQEMIFENLFDEVPVEHGPGILWVGIAKLPDWREIVMARR